MKVAFPSKVRTLQVAFDAFTSFARSAAYDFERIASTGIFTKRGLDRARLLHEHPPVHLREEAEHANGAPDPQRKGFTRQEIIEAHFNLGDRVGPKGHGFSRCLGGAGHQVAFLVFLRTGSVIRDRCRDRHSLRPR